MPILAFPGPGDTQLVRGPAGWLGEDLALPQPGHMCWGPKDIGGQGSTWHGHLRNRRVELGPGRGKEPG